MTTKLERLDYSLRTLPNGDDQSLHDYRMRGTSPGPIVYIQANVHGAEVQGNAVIWELMRFFSENEFKGSLTFVPTANPQALNHKSGTYTQGRFNPLSGNNWNRNYTDITESKFFKIDDFLNEFGDSDETTLKKKFKEYLFQCLKSEQESLSEYGLSTDRKVNLILQELACAADIVLDLHTGPVATRYLYSAQFEKDKAKDLGFPFTLIIPNEFAGAMDEACFIPWVVLADNLNRKGSRDSEYLIPIESYTLELGSEEIIDSKAAKEDACLILNYLKLRGMLDKGAGEKLKTDYLHISHHQKACLLSDYKTYNARKGGLVEYFAKPGQHLKAEEPLCQILSYKDLKEIEDLEKCYEIIPAKKDAIIINHNPSAVVSEGDPLYQVMEDHFDL